MGRVVRYTGKALETAEKLMGEQFKSGYTPNKIYKCNGSPFHWYINSQGYLHVLEACRVKISGRNARYHIADCLLNRENMLRESSLLGRFDSLEIAQAQLNQANTVKDLGAKY